MQRKKVVAEKPKKVLKRRVTRGGFTKFESEVLKLSTELGIDQIEMIGSLEILKFLTQRVIEGEGSK
jgi:hypothetical protein